MFLQDKLQFCCRERVFLQSGKPDIAVLREIRDMTCYYYTLKTGSLRGLYLIACSCCRTVVGKLGESVMDNIEAGLSASPVLYSYSVFLLG